MLKRGVDIALSSILLLCSLPVLALAAVLIKMDSEGPVFFSQLRVGRRFSRFQIWKLRTMRDGARGPVHTLGEDERITRAGHWLRWLKFDELPQLWNVLCGDMSLVGPRPVVPALALEFRQEYIRLLEVRPGITDPASVKYCRECELLALEPDQCRYFKTVLIPDKLRISGAYLRRANFWTDLCVLAQTVLALVPSSAGPRRGLLRPGLQGGLLRPVAMRPEERLRTLPPVFQKPEQDPKRSRDAEPAFKKPPAAEKISLPDAAGLASGLKEA